MHVVQALYRVTGAGQEETSAQLVIPDMVWESRESVPHGGIDAGIPAIFGQFLPKPQADCHDWHAQPDALIDAGDKTPSWLSATTRGH
jgi:hypothetical protein